jgi:hypothetical protein
VKIEDVLELGLHGSRWNAVAAPRVEKVFNYLIRQAFIYM